MATPVEHFRQLGVSEPELWAKSEADEGIDQIARATVLRAFADLAKATPSMAAAMADSPMSTPDVQAALTRLRADPQTAEDTDLVLQAVSVELLFGVCSLLSGAAVPDVNPANVELGLARLDDNFQPSSGIESLHESWNEVAAAILGPKVVRS